MLTARSDGRWQFACRIILIAQVCGAVRRGANASNVSVRARDKFCHFSRGVAVVIINIKTRAAVPLSPHRAVEIIPMIRCGWTPMKGVGVLHAIS